LITTYPAIIHLISTLFASVVLTSIVAYYIPNKTKYLVAGKIPRFLATFFNSIISWKYKPGVIRLLCWVTILSLIFFSVRIWLAFEISGATLLISEILILQTSLAVVFAVSFVPGNLGLKEGAIVGLASVFDIDPQVAFTAALLDRTST